MGSNFIENIETLKWVVELIVYVVVGIATILGTIKVNGQINLVRTYEAAVDAADRIKAHLSESEAPTTDELDGLIEGGVSLVEKIRSKTLSRKLRSKVRERIRTLVPNPKK